MQHHGVQSTNLGPDILRYGIAMIRPACRHSSSLLLFLMYAAISATFGQSPTAPDNSALAKQGVALAQEGRCREALPKLRNAAAHLADKKLKYQAAMATARCGMSLDQTETAVNALLLLNREFPRDPQVLYTTTHFYA